MFTIKTTTPAGHTNYRGTFTTENLAWNNASSIKLLNYELTVEVIPLPEGVTPSEEFQVYL